MTDIGTIAMTDARDNLADVVNKVAFGKTRISLTRKNKPVAYLVPIEDIELLEAIEDRLDILALDKMVDEMDGQENISLEALKNL